MLKDIIIINKNIVSWKQEDIFNLERDLRDCRLDRLQDGDIIYLESGFSVPLGYNLQVLDAEYGICKLVSY